MRNTNEWQQTESHLTLWKRIYFLERVEGHSEEALWECSVNSGETAPEA